MAPGILQNGCLGTTRPTHFPDGGRLGGSSRLSPNHRTPRAKAELLEWCGGHRVSHAPTSLLGPHAVFSKPLWGQNGLPPRSEVHCLARAGRCLPVADSCGFPAPAAVDMKSPYSSAHLHYGFAEGKTTGHFCSLFTPEGGREVGAVSRLQAGVRWGGFGKEVGWPHSAAVLQIRTT